MKSIIILLLCAGIIMVVTGYNKSLNKSSRPKIEYRYVPRTFFEEQISPTNLKQSFNSMFNDPSIWNKYPFNK